MDFAKFYERRRRIRALGVKIATDEQLPGCWIATDDGYDGPGSPIGRGMTEQAAIDDLLDQLEESNDGYDRTAQV